MAKRNGAFKGSGNVAPEPKRGASKRGAGPGSDGLPTSDYRHKTTKRKNIPPAKIAAEGTVPAVAKARYAYSPHLTPVLRFDPTADADRAAAKVAALIDKAAKGALTEGDRATLREALDNREPWLEWATKREQHQRGMFEVDPVALHIHERVSAQAIMRVAARQGISPSLFADPEQSYNEAVQFYRHDIDWTNRLILGDSLQVMSSLARREDLAGKVQMIYMDPPYGIKFASNFQPEVGNRDVKDKDSDLTREPEMVRAYRDTWHLGVHSYLSYLRDRLIAAKELLSDTGSIFVQISDENLHSIRAIMDEVFGVQNFCAVIAFNKTSGFTPKLLSSVADYLIWFARDKEQIKYRPLYTEKSPIENPSERYICVETRVGNVIDLSYSQKAGGEPIPEGRILKLRDTCSQGPGEAREFEFEGQTLRPPATRHWSIKPDTIPRFLNSGLAYCVGKSLLWKCYLDVFSFRPATTVWTDIRSSGFGEDKVYVVQTLTDVVKRCMLMTTEPGDLVLDPTCGSGTTSYVAEQWGRRWITTDTSRVAIAIARQRLLTAKYDYFKTKAVEGTPNGNPGVGLRYRTVPHVKLSSIAQNTNLDPILAIHEPLLGDALARANKCLEAVTDAIRQTLCGKLANEAARSGLGTLSDTDYRRWLLPSTKPLMIAQAIDRAFRSFEKKSPTAKQVAAIADCVPTRAAVGRSSVPPSGLGWEHWQVPFDTDPEWPKVLQEAVTAYRAAWRAKMDEVNACVAANAKPEELVDQPEIVKGITRVSGPFTVEAVMPPEMSLGDPLALPADTGEFGGAPGELDDAFTLPREVNAQGDIDTKNAMSYLKQMFDLLKQDGVRFLNNKQMKWSRLDPLYESGSTTGGSGVHAEGRWSVAGNGADPDPNGRATVAVVFGPQYGPVTAKMVESLIPVAGRALYEDLVIAGFSFDGTASVVIDEAAGRDGGKGIRMAGGHYMRIHMAHIRPDVNPGMNGLLKEQPGSQLFTVFGQPRIRIDGPGKVGSMGRLGAKDDPGEPPEGEYTATMEGVDIYDPVRNTIEPTKADKVAAWFLDSDYDGRTFCITQAFFPDRSAWEKLAKALGGVVDAERFEALSGTTSLPFPKGKHGKVAVKVIDPRGNEVMKVVAL